MEIQGTCQRCGKSIIKNSNAQKYCPECAKEVKLETNRKFQKKNNYADQREYQKTEKGKAASAKSFKTYSKTEKGKAALAKAAKRYNQKTGYKVQKEYKKKNLKSIVVSDEIDVIEAFKTRCKEKGTTPTTEIRKFIQSYK